MQSINASLTLQHTIWAESIQAHPATAYLECGVVDLCEILFFLGGDPIFLARDGKAWPCVQNRRGAGHRNEKNGFEIGGGKGTKTKPGAGGFLRFSWGIFRQMPAATRIEGGIKRNAGMVRRRFGSAQNFSPLGAWNRRI